MTPEFDQKVVVVTGGSRGIGRAIVERFTTLGARVFFTYHQREEARYHESVYGDSDFTRNRLEERRDGLAAEIERERSRGMVSA